MDNMESEIKENGSPSNMQGQQIGISLGPNRRHPQLYNRIGFRIGLTDIDCI